MTIYEFDYEIGFIANEAVNKINSISEFLMETCKDYRTMLDTAIDRVYAENGTDEDIEFFEAEAKKEAGGKIQSGIKRIYEACKAAILRIVEKIRSLLSKDKEARAKEIADKNKEKTVKIPDFNTIDKAALKLRHENKIEVAKLKAKKSDPRVIQDNTEEFKKTAEQAMKVLVPVTLAAALAIINKCEKRSTEMDAELDIRGVYYDDNFDYADPLGQTNNELQFKLANAHTKATIELAKAYATVASKVYAAIGNLSSSREIDPSLPEPKKESVEVDDLDNLIEEAREEVIKGKAEEYLERLEDYLG